MEKESKTDLAEKSDKGETIGGQTTRERGASEFWKKISLSRGMSKNNRNGVVL